MLEKVVAAQLKTYLQHFWETSIWVPQYLDGPGNSNQWPADGGGCWISIPSCPLRPTSSIWHSVSFHPSGSSLRSCPGLVPVLSAWAGRVCLFWWSKILNPACQLQCPSGFCPWSSPVSASPYMCHQHSLCVIPLLCRWHTAVHQDWADTHYNRFTPLSPQGLITVILSSFGSQARIFKSSKTFKTSTARILRVRKYDHITPILNTLHCLLMEHRIVYKVSLLTNHGMYGNAYLKELLMNQTSSRPFCSSTANLLNTTMGILVLALECPGPVYLTPLPRVPTDRSNDLLRGASFS